MHAKLKKGHRISEVYSLDGLTPHQMMMDHNADEIHLVKKNGQYRTHNGEIKQKWRTVEIIKSEPITKPKEHMNHINTHYSNPIEESIVPPVLSNDALQVQVMFLKEQLNHVKSECNRFKDQYETYKTKFEQADRELFTTKQDHKDELRKIEKDQESGLNGFIDKNPEIAIKAMEIFGPVLTNKFGGNQNQLKGLESNLSEELTSIFDYLNQFDTSDTDLIDTVVKLCHIHDKKINFAQIKEHITNTYNEN